MPYAPASTPSPKLGPQSAHYLPALNRTAVGAWWCFAVLPPVERIDANERPPGDRLSLWCTGQRCQQPTLHRNAMQCTTKIRPLLNSRALGGYLLEKLPSRIS